LDRKPVIALLAILTAGCGRQSTLTVGAKNFSEQLLLGEIMAQQIERRLGEKVTRKFNLGGTILAHEALLHGEIDLYPEYTGTALSAILKQPANPDAAATLAKVRAAYRQWGLEWLQPLGFENTFALAVRREDAEREHISTLSEARRRSWILGAGYEFATRPDGLAGFQAVYHIPLTGAPLTMDLGLLYRALENRQIDMAAANSTDGQLVSGKFRVLEDDRHFFPAYEAAFVVRSAVLNAQRRRAMEELSGKLTAERIRQLNFQVVVSHTPIEDVARDFLATLVTNSGGPRPLPGASRTTVAAQCKSVSALNRARQQADRQTLYAHFRKLALAADAIGR
jgi:osmoprotectant transport system substrate-binding protein